MTAHNGIWVGNRQHDIVPANGFEEEKDLSIIFRGSRNQRIIDVKKSLKKDEVILHEKDSDRLGGGKWQK